jgi:transposase
MRAVLKAQINKTDRNDARGIAQMMRVGLYRPVHVKTLRSQKLRMLRSTKWSWLRAWPMKIARHRGMKKAIVALARRLAVIMHRIWVDGTEFRWTREVTAA